MFLRTSVYSLLAVIALAASRNVLSVSSHGQDQTARPRVELPAPTGKHSVGRTSFHWIDSSRGEEMTDDPSDRRELMVTLWYPAETTAAEPAPYIDNLDRLAGAMDPLHVTIARSVRPHSVATGKIASAEPRYPVLIFSPGNETNVALYAAQTEDLASHGYIVVGIDYPYESLAVLYPDGRIVRYSEEKHPKPGTANFPEEAGRFYRQRVDWRAADATFVLNQLERLNSGKPASQFRGRLDLARVGALGHSIGGIAAAQSCQSDRRFKSCLNLDGHAKSIGFYPDSNGKGPEQPFMILEDTPQEPTERQLAEWKMTREQVEKMRERERIRSADSLKTVKSGSYRVTLRGATHQSFSDETLILPFGDAVAKAANRRRTQIIREFTLAFFEQSLRQRNSALLNGSTSNYPEVVVERFSASQP